MPYTASQHVKKYSPEELRARIPGWGVDSDPADRPSYPRERRGPDGQGEPAPGVHWTFPPRQEPSGNRERSVEHEMLPPVFGTAQPLHGVSGAIRRFAYDRYSEGQTAHWLLLVLGDRVDAVGSHLRSFATARPDNPVTETGILAEPGHRPISSRFGQNRADLKHTWLDPIIVVGPWVLTGVVAVRLIAKLARR
ncbi:hypothetical protein P5G50_05900 [Leifsonia sp. F6_8S_P_1B]|uniref:Uncharacterized protein n=1 Tax=Leifsonia williamsii TaxID=3035919 RepID=A0ABT8K956_9MICO|nr:hypothetical protein [Leifsonia williamsii]MDN4613983.1 hypothetical protein [Leifsonia williamsii]